MKQRGALRGIDGWSSVVSFQTPGDLFLALLVCRTSRSLFLRLRETKSRICIDLDHPSTVRWLHNTILTSYVVSCYSYLPPMI